MIKEFDIQITSQEYAETCVINAEVRKQIHETFLAKARLFSDLGHKISVE
jgi:hypothetical protein